jgi:hypothetical protein
MPNTQKTESTFRLEYTIVTPIAAPPTTIWRHLTNAAAFPSWNSTVTSIDGDISLGNTLKIKVPISPDRTFSPKVVTLEPNQKMVWADGFAPMFKGERIFTLTEGPNGTTEFRMTEVFSGLMLPMIKGSLPDFRPVFDRYAADLRGVSERA